MADLTACYFCGAATDVRERSVIPAALEPDDDHQRTVAVCPACDEKLSAVLDPVVAHVAGSEPDDGPVATGSEVDPDRPEPSTDADTDTEADDSGLVFARPTDGPEGEPSAPSEDPGADAAEPQDDASGGSERSERATQGGDGGAFPAGTRRVLRLLQNRDRPIRRDGLVDLATNAYGLEYTRAREVVETLLDRGVLTVRDDGTVALAERGAGTGNGD